MVDKSAFITWLPVAAFVAAFSLLYGAAAEYAAAAEPAGRSLAQAVKSSEPIAATKKLTPQELKIREEWRKSMLQIPFPKKSGCFESAYPKKEWKEVPCKKAPEIPMTPRRGPRPQVIGAGNDISAEAPSGGFISSATGLFDAMNNVTSISSPIGNQGAAVNNAYTLQINTNFFNSTACAGSLNPNCRGWEQFVYFTDGNSGSLFIQYWLIQYNANCPTNTNWNQFQFTGDTDIYCYRNATNSAAPPNVTAANLGQVVMTGAVSATGDSISLSTGSSMFAATGDNSVSAAAGWQIAEFNVFGAGGNSAGGGQASFNNGATAVPRTRVTYGGTAAPNCVAQGFTGETNNLNFGPNAPAATPAGPAVIFTESSAGGAATNCAASSSIGDTHLATFQGMLYDFQAQGDFVLAEVDPGFVVQARQVLGTPTWPSASVNHAVATRIGKTRVAVCLGLRLAVDGESTDLADGKSVLVHGGVTISRNGNSYLIVGESGDSVRAEVNPSWINVWVGLGRWPAKVRGLVANAGRNQIAARDGTVLTAPFPFEPLYHHYADSWRVPDNDSLLSYCGTKIARAIPQRPFYAKDLDPKVREHAEQICKAAKVQPGPLFEACTLDVAVIGDEKAARVFADTKPPKNVGRVVRGAR